MQYLVSATGSPGLASPAETLKVLEDQVLPLFESLMRWTAEKKILAGGVPVGGRALVFIAEASSHSDLDRMLRSLRFLPKPFWFTTCLNFLQTS